MSDFLMRYMKADGSVQTIANLAGSGPIADVQWVDIKVAVPRPATLRIGGQFISVIKVKTGKEIRICMKGLINAGPDWDNFPKPHFDLVCRESNEEPDNGKNVWWVDWLSWLQQLDKSNWLSYPVPAKVQQARIGEWFNPENCMREPGSGRADMRRPMPWDAMGILKAESKDKAGNAILQVSIWHAPDENLKSSEGDYGDLHIYLYSATVLNRGDDARIITGALTAMTGASFNDSSLRRNNDKWCLSPALLSMSLGPDSRDGDGSSAFLPRCWSALLNWQAREYKDTDDGPGPRPRGWEPLDFLWLWNQAARPALASAKLLSGGTPLVGFPIFSCRNDEASSKYLRSNILLDLGSEEGVRHIFPAIEAASEPLSAAFVWKWDDSIIGWDADSGTRPSPNAQWLILRGGKLSSNAQGPNGGKDSTTVGQWNPLIEGAPYAPYSIEYIKGGIPCVGKELDEIIKQIKINFAHAAHIGTERILSAFEITFSAWDTNHLKEGGIRLGSLLMRPTKAGENADGNEEVATLKCTLRGAWTNTSCEIYPEFELKLKGCTVETSGLSDSGVQDTFTQFDVIAGEEDRLQRESSALLHPRAVLATNADFKLRFKSERARNSLLELTINSQVRNKTDDAKAAYFFNARPYLEAQLDPIQFDPEAGEQIASWRSNDPDGPQWRFGYAALQFKLPAQAVGEEMERGKRFWTDIDPGTEKERSYIRRDRPVRYRFSPPTAVAVRPGIEDRRYNKNPANFREIIRDADVENFSTEAVYPLAMRFARDQNRLPDVRLTEAAEFFGKPAENLPFLAPTKKGGKDGDSLLSEFLSENGLLDVYLAQWFEDTASSDTKQKAGDYYRALRGAQAAARINFVSRIAVMHLHDPYRKDHNLFLTKGLEFRLRGKNEQAPGLINPLPVGIELGHDDRNLLAAKGFIDPGVDWRDPAAVHGAFRGGLMHTMEFPSELTAVLRSPVSKDGTIENLSFSALGASGKVSASFDEGRTTFTAEVQYGQAARIVKTRIGRVGVLWNKSKHVVIYERTTVPSQQFKDEQSEEFNGWPILRKAEEYIDLIEEERPFETEKAASESRPGALFSSRFFTRRIYVNGAWGRDLKHGYEIPLWNKEDTSGFYPMPYMALMTHAAGDEKTRQKHEEPHALVFYSNTEPDTGADSNTWLAKVLVDFRAGWRSGVVASGKVGTDAEKRADADRVLDASSLPNPGPDMPRNPRFDMAVLSEGAGNIQHSRGDSPMLVKFSLLTVERTALANADPIPVPANGNGTSIPSEALDCHKSFQTLAGASMKVRSIEEEVKKFIASLDPRKLGFGDLQNSDNCKQVADKLRQKADSFFKDLNERKDSSLSQGIAILTKFPKGGEELEKSLRGMLEERIQLPVSLLNEFVKGWALEIKALRLAQGRALESWVSQKESLMAEVTRVIGKIYDVRNGIKGRLKAAGDRIKGTIDKPFEDTEKQLTQLEEEIRAKSNSLSGVPPNADLEDFVQKVGGQIAIVRQYLSSVADPRLQTMGKQVCDLLGRAAAEVESADKKAVADAQTLLNGAAGRVKAAVDAVKAARTFIGEALKVLEPEAGSISKALDLSTNTCLLTPLDEFYKKVKDSSNGREPAIQEFLDKLEKSLLDGAIAGSNALSVEYRKLSESVLNGFNAAAHHLVKAIDTLSQHYLASLKTINTEATDQLTHCKDEVRKIIDSAEQSCSDVMAKLSGELEKLNQWAKKTLTDVVTGALDSEAQKQLEKLDAYAESFKDKGAQAIKLTKAIGDIPSLPHLSFNADRAEYVFDDVRKQIETSPFAMKMRDIDDGLKGLGLAVPTRQLLDQFVPDRLKDLDFGKVFNNLGGVDFRNICKDLKIPDLNSDHVKVTHGFDKQTRSAWAKATIQFEAAAESTVFEGGAVAVKMAAMTVNATSDIRIAQDGRRSQQTEGVLTCDLALDVAGNRLAVFRQVTITFNSHGKFDFNISPEKIELHASIKFISDFAKQFEGSLPPAIQVEKDKRGFPIGARASFETKVENLPPLGVVSIGTLALASGLNLRCIDGDFQIGAHISVGTRSTPIFVQISFLGGGVWVESRAWLEKGTPRYAVTVGLAVGSTRTFTLGGVARASYAILIFANVEFSSGSAGYFSVGILMEGSARILGLASASVRLLLEAKHEGGSSRGTGTLDVSVEICWCYTLRVRQSVTKEL